MRPGPRGAKLGVLQKDPGATCEKTRGKYLVSSSDGAPIGFGDTATKAWQAALDELAASIIPVCDHCAGEKLVEHRFMQGAYGGSNAEYPYDPPLVECENCDGTGEASDQ